jgi:putative endonuclease
MSPRGLGAWGEETAARFLSGKGLHIIDRNWRGPEGELDLVARQADSVVFVEVKARRTRDFGPPEEAITTSKQRKLRKTAWAYLQAHELSEADWRIDVVAIEQAPDGEVARLDHYVNAIGAETGGGRP